MFVLGNRTSGFVYFVPSVDIFDAASSSESSRASSSSKPGCAARTPTRQHRGRRHQPRRCATPRHTAALESAKHMQHIMRRVSNAMLRPRTPRSLAVAAKKRQAKCPRRGGQRTHQRRGQHCARDAHTRYKDPWATYQGLEQVLLHLLQRIDRDGHGREAAHDKITTPTPR